jgi:hypothetical protein
VPQPSRRHPNNIWRRVQVMEMLIMQFRPTACYFISHRSKYPNVCAFFIKQQLIWSPIFFSERYDTVYFKNRTQLLYLYFLIALVVFMSLILH